MKCLVFIFSALFLAQAVLAFELNDKLDLSIAYPGATKIQVNEKISP